MHTSLTDCTKEIESEKETLDELIKQYNKNVLDKRNYIHELERQKSLLLSSLDMVKINLAEHVLNIDICEPLFGDDFECIDEAILELANNNGKRLFTSRNSTKNYSGFYHQHCGWMEYGCGPRHGEIIFSVGATKCFIENPRDLTTEEIEASIYLLEMLKAGKWVSLKKFQSEMNREKVKL